MCADDIAATQPSLDIVARLTSRVAISDRAPFQHEHQRTPMDDSTAARILDWRSDHDWPDRGQSDGDGRVIEA